MTKQIATLVFDVTQKGNQIEQPKMLGEQSLVYLRGVLHLTVCAISREMKNNSFEPRSDTELKL